MRRLRRAGVLLLALATSSLPILGSQPASAAVQGVGAHAAAMVPCVAPFDFDSRRPAPYWRRYEDHSPVEAEDIAAVQAVETTRKVVAQEVAPRLGRAVTIPVYVHVIKGKHRGERVPAGPKRVKRVLRILNNGFSGAQSKQNAPTRYRFQLRKITYTKNDGWYHAYLNGPRDKRMKQKLHRGGARTLNLYINGGGPKYGPPVLGWARFPWQYRKAPRLDHVTVNVDAMPWGRARGYNKGDTVIHEVGHWMGLFHTFQGGCSVRNDLVADTPAEQYPSYECEVGRDTCPAPGLDPVRNFMDYSLDACMNQFTPGQVRRMDASFEKWRH